jgi:16S rRNA G966 N2-methylase RsmD
VIRWDIRRNLNCLHVGTHAFDLVFLDPPYRRDLVAITLHHLLESEALDPAAWVVAEHAPVEAIAFDSPQLRIFDQRRYGKTLVSFFGPVV